IIYLAVFERFADVAEDFRRIDRLRGRAAQDEFLNEFSPRDRWVAPVGLHQYFIRSDDSLPTVAEPHQQIAEMIFLAAIQNIRVACGPEFRMPLCACGAFVPARRLQHPKMYLRPIRSRLYLLAKRTGLFRGSGCDFATRIEIILRSLHRMVEVLDRAILDPLVDERAVEFERVGQ